MISLEECWFYHTFDFPGIGLVPGNWDLRGREADYLGGVDVKGKSVLDVGSASGFITFHMEAQGARVTGFDIDPNILPDLLPHKLLISAAQVRKHNYDFYTKLSNSFDFAKQQLGMQSQHVQGNIYNLKNLVDQAQISIVGAILVHLRDPFLALANIANRTTETMVITERYYENPEYHAVLRAGQMLPERIGKHQYLRRAYRRLGKLLFGEDLTDHSTGANYDLATMLFLPDAEDEMFAGRLNSWYAFSPLALTRMLKILGFGSTHLTFHKQKYHDGNEHNMMTIVAHRTDPLDEILSEYPF